MNEVIQIILVVIGALLAALNALIVYILSDVKEWLKKVEGTLYAHIVDKSLHTSCGKEHR